MLYISAALLLPRQAGIKYNHGNSWMFARSVVDFIDFCMRTIYATSPEPRAAALAMRHECLFLNHDLPNMHEPANVRRRLFMEKNSKCKREGNNRIQQTTTTVWVWRSTNTFRASMAVQLEEQERCLACGAAPFTTSHHLCWRVHHFMWRFTLQFGTRKTSIGTSTIRNRDSVFNMQ